MSGSVGRTWRGAPPLLDRRLLHCLMLALGAFLLGSWLVPESWVRWLLVGRPPHERAALELDPRADDEALRLIPIPSLRQPDGAPPSARTITIRPSPEFVATERPEPEERSTQEWSQEWSFDPTSPHRIARDLFHLEAVGSSPDSLRARGALLRHLALGTPELVRSVVDTTQLAMANKAFRGFDEWINAVHGPRWEAQGDAQRLRDLIWRAFVEHESEGGP